MKESESSPTHLALAHWPHCDSDSVCWLLDLPLTARPSDAKGLAAEVEKSDLVFHLLWAPVEPA